MTITPLPSPNEIKTMLPISSLAANFIQESREISKHIIDGSEPRKALIIGPCSIHDRKSAVEYAKRFKALSEEVKHTCFMVMRVYVEKPRTSTGWKGLLYDPHLNGTHEIKTGLIWTRELLIELAEMQIPCAAEFVDPLAALYFEDLITWGFIGARTSSSQPHRQFASSLEMPIGFKNATDGNLESAIHGVLSAKKPHTFMYVSEEGKLCTLQSKGNLSAHIVLRGANDFTNYDQVSVNEAASKLKSIDLSERLMIDCAHGNCRKRFEKQRDTFLSIIEQIEKGDGRIFGLMLESHLENGSQPLCDDPSQLKYAVSITDPCLDWKETEELVYAANTAFSSGILTQALD